MLRIYIKEGKTESMNNLNYAEKLTLNLIAWGKKKGLKVKEVREWYLTISRAPFQDEVDKKVLEILDMATAIESES